MEEALAVVSLGDALAGDGDAVIAQRAGPIKYSCAVSMEETSCPMLSTFEYLEPGRPIGE